MNINQFIYNLSDLEQEYSDEIYEFCNKLFNLNLSLTGDDVKKLLKSLNNVYQLKLLK